MRVLLISAVPPPSGGIATWTIGFMDYCNANNIDYKLINTAVSGQRAKNFTKKRNIIDELSRTYRIVKEVLCNSKKFDPDIVHFNTSCSRYGLLRDYICISVLFFMRRKIILQCHCNIQDQTKTKSSLCILKRTAKKVKCVLVLNSLSKQYLFEKTGYEAVIVPNFIEVKDIKQHKVSSQISRITYDGRVEEKKGCKEIINAAKLFKSIRFELIGTIADDIKEMDCPDNVEFTGALSQSDVVERLDHSDVFLFPSYTEGFSISVLEAMRSGLPIIATDVGANRDMIGNEGGIIIRPQSVDDIVSAIQNIMDISKRTKMSIRNQTVVQQQYSTEKVLGHIVDIYTSIINGIESNYPQ